MSIPVVDYKEHRIEVTEDFLFKVTGELVDQRAFKSMAEAREHIDDAVLAHWKQERAVLTLDALTGRGKSLKIRGINAGTGYLMTTDKEFDKEGRAQTLYPDARWAVPLLSERLQLLNRLQDIRKQLEPLEISTYRAYKRLKPGEHDREVAKLVEEHAKKLALARQREKDEAPENTGPAPQPTGNDANHINARGQPEY